MGTFARRSGLVILSAAVVGVVLSACPRTPPPGASTPTPAPTPPITPAPTPTPPPYVPAKRLEVGKLFNGVQLRATFETEEGSTATEDRNEPSSYSLDLKLKVKVPKPHKDLAAI